MAPTSAEGQAMTAIDLRPLPHREAIEYFSSKGYAPFLQRFHHLDLFREEHARNWVVAKAMRDDISRAIRDEMTRALAEGRTLRQFQQTLAPRLQELGWWGRQAMQDPLTGETREVQLGSMRRLRTIFDTNMRTAHAAGHWASIQRTARAFPYLEYIQIDRPTKRHDHTRFHGKIWRVDVGRCRVAPLGAGSVVLERAGERLAVGRGRGLGDARLARAPPAVARKGERAGSHRGTLPRRAPAHHRPPARAAVGATATGNVRIPASSRARVGPPYNARIARVRAP